MDSGGITVGGTRLIYGESRREVSLSVSNSDIHPYLIQSWVENLDRGSGKSPFLVTPPLFRLDGNQQDLLRVVRTGDLPKDRESLFWLNVKSIPSTSERDSVNTLQIAVKTRIKLIYRPKTLKGVPEDMADKLSWNLSDNKLTVYNPTPFVMNFNRVKVGNAEVKDVTYVLPMSSATFKAPSVGNGPLSWNLITDYGGEGAVHTAANNSQPKEQTKRAAVYSEQSAKPVRR
ncbi:molecular chaperone [Serratia sp. UGAL515B_01]|nr:molecular chaperone [Serratia sp. UGAL515B_01]